jgi:hypothetical protein
VLGGQVHDPGGDGFELGRVVPPAVGERQTGEEDRQERIEQYVPMITEPA